MKRVFKIAVFFTTVFTVTACTVDPQAGENLNRIKILEAELKENQKQISELKLSLEILKLNVEHKNDTLSVRILKK